MALGDFLSGLFGGGGGGSAINDTMSGFAPALSPGQSDAGGFVAPTSDDPSTSISQTGNAGSGSGVNATSIAKALQQLQQGLNQAQASSGGVAQHGAAPVGSAQSGVGQGNASGINALLQMLNAKRNSYFPGAPNTQPVTQPRTAGLLGL